MNKLICFSFLFMIAAASLTESPDQIIRVKRQFGFGMYPGMGGMGMGMPYGGMGGMPMLSGFSKSNSYSYSQSMSMSGTNNQWGLYGR